MTRQYNNKDEEGLGVALGLYEFHEKVIHDYENLEDTLDFYPFGEIPDVEELPIYRTVLAVKGYLDMSYAEKELLK